MIKKCFLMTALCLSVLAISQSCKKTNQPKEPETIADKIELESRNLSCSPNATTLTTTVTTANGITKVESSSDWCKVSFDGTTVILEVAENASAMSRDATISVVSGTETAKIALNQEGVVFDFPLSGQAISTNDVAKDTVVAFTANANFVFSSSVDWASAAKSEDGLKISLQENTTGAIRTGTVYMTFGELKDSVFVTQSDFVGTYGNSMNIYYCFWDPYFASNGGPVTFTNDKMTINGFWGNEEFYGGTFGFEGPFSFPIKLRGDEQGHYVVTVEAGSFLGNSWGNSFFLAFVLGGYQFYWSGFSLDIVFTKEKDAEGKEFLIGRFANTIYDSKDPSIVYDFDVKSGSGFLWAKCFDETNYPDNFSGEAYPMYLPIIISKEWDVVHNTEDSEEYYRLTGFEDNF